MTGRYEIRDRDMPGRGERFTSLDRARTVLANANAVNGARPGRFYLFDRLDKCEVENVA